ncbi:ABC transporter permease [Rosenbergiella collisarenosi]|uniref:ABC transporter permease n=1 Tax=Rosenbergiella collisarenosi TaxID=1544695 RepID=UPI001BDAF7D9|nr:ABC transporter permease [Rosenbergiella collisarenosi]MBT0722600.1 ABC transporter permease [Rosenbergiella collisarenosi]
MAIYSLKRLGQGLIVLWAAWTLSFVLLQLLPGDAVLIKFLDPSLGLSADQVAQMRKVYGEGTPLWQQYFSALNTLLHGNLGYSVQLGVPVTDVLAANFPQTLKLIIPGFFLALIVGPGLAILAWLPGLKVLRNLLLALPSLLVSLPVFWLGIVLIQVFSFHLHWVSIINPSPIGGMVLPVITLALPIAAPLAQIFMRSIDQVRTQPFVAAARARGLSQQRVLFKHVLRNASLPLLTVAGLLLGELIAGALVTETVFGLNGLGQVTQQAVDSQDVNVLQAVVMISALAYVVINLFADLVTPLLDPRLNLVAGGSQ